MSSYVESIIGAGERVEYEGKVSPWSLLPLFVLGLILLPLFGLGLLFWLIAFLQYKTTELAITNRKIIAKFGFIKRDTIEMLLPKVETIQVKQSIFGRMLNYGTVVVSGAGNPQAPVPGIASPVEFRKKFMDIQERIEVRAEAAPERARQAPQRPAPAAVGAAPEGARPILKAAPAQTGPTCSSCGAAVQATDVFCESCGARQAPRRPAPAVTGAAPEAAAPILEAALAQAGPTCSSCGAAVQATDVYCESCGTRLGA